MSIRCRMQRCAFKTFLWAWLILTMAPCRAGAGDRIAGRRPNILFILTDVNGSERAGEGACAHTSTFLPE